MINRRIDRRRFLQATAGAAALLAWPRRAYPFAQSPLGITKFAVTLPGLTPAGQNELHNYIPVLQATGSPAVYRIVAAEFTQQIHPAIPPTKFWGYADATTKDLKYLGGVIVVNRGTPVQLTVVNELPGMHILPVDTTLIDPAAGAAEQTGRTDRIAIHLHGGFVFWDSDGGPFAWFSSANPSFVKGSSFINGNGVPGEAVYNYPNDQSARFIWYHDHAYGLTRTNVFAGLASAYLITDNREEDLISVQKVIPDPPLGGVTAPYHLGIPLIIQDKTFWDGKTAPGSRDPGYASVAAGAVEGSLWYPHVYEGGADPDGLPGMGIPPDPMDAGNDARWGQTVPPPNPLPSPSTVPEYFSDTILVNGAPYPKVPVTPARYRFRFINASNARFYNLQLYVADSSPDGITLANTGELDPNNNPTLAPTNRPGPAFIQIGNECGFLPAPVVFSPDSTVSKSGSGAANINSNRIMGYKLSSSPVAAAGHLRADAGRNVQRGNDKFRLDVTAGDPTIGNADRYNLLMASAERPDVIIDFRGFRGKSLILYNDAPAPFPGGDIRNDYFGGPLSPDLTSIGGAPPTVAGEGPDTRVLMRFDVADVADSTEMTFAQTVAALQQQLPTIFNGIDQPLTNIQPDPNSTFSKSLLEDFEDPVEGFGRLRQLIGDGAGNPFTLVDMPIQDVATVGQVQRWQIFNLTADTHPMHFHLVNVAVRGRQPWAFDSNGNPVPDAMGNLQVLPGSTMTPPDPNEMGWKETVRMNPGEVTTVDMMFDLPMGTPPMNSPRLQSTSTPGAEYVWHCHILEHEEHDMMHTLVVQAVQPASAKK